MDDKSKLEYKSISLNFEPLLANKGISRYELAKQAGVHYTTLDRYFKNNITRYDKDILLRICKVFGCDIGDLIKIE